MERSDMCLSMYFILLWRIVERAHLFHKCLLNYTRREKKPDLLNEEDAGEADLWRHLRHLNIVAITKGDRGL